MIPIDSLISLVKRNIRKWGDYYGLSERCGDWARELGLKKGGSTVLYTGCLYQLTPYIDETVKYIKLLDKHPSLARVFLRSASLIRPSLVIRPSRNEYEPLYGAISLLRLSGIDFGYLYDEDIYSGAHLWDLGLEEEARRHGEVIKSILIKNDVKKVITIDPHTTYMLSEVYPSIVDGFEFEVKTVIELVNSNCHIWIDDDNGSWVVHDPCYFSRYRDLTSEFREFAKALGIRVLEPERSGRMTSCCGGPIEWMRYDLATSIAEKRADELLSVGRRIVTYCPICLSNLRRVCKADVEDIYALAYKIIMHKKLKTMV